MGRPHLAARRRELGLTQEQLAYVLGHDPTTIGRWERGTTAPLPDHRPALARALDVSLAELAALLSGPPSTDVAPGFEVVDRTACLRATTRQLIDLDTHHGGDDVLPLAARSFRTARSHLAATPDDRDLASAVAEAGQVAAWIAYDANDQRLSRQLHDEALLVARLAGDRSLELFVLASLAMQAAHTGNGAEALRIADDTLAAHDLRGTTAALFHLRRARALALTGDRTRALRARSRTRALLSDGPRPTDPTWTWWITEAELSWHDGMILATTDGWPASIDHFAAAVSLRDESLHRSHYNDTAHLWLAQVSAEAWTDAEPVAIDLATRADTIRSTRTDILLHRTIAKVRRAPRTPTALTDATATLHQSLTS